MRSELNSSVLASLRTGAVLVLLGPVVCVLAQPCIFPPPPPPPSSPGYTPVGGGSPGANSQGPVGGGALPGATEPTGSPPGGSTPGLTPQPPSVPPNLTPVLRAGGVPSPSSRGTTRPAGGRPGAPTRPAGKKASSPTLGWNYWWNLNKWEFLHIRDLMRRQGAVTVADDVDLGAIFTAPDAKAASPARNLSPEIVRDQVLPALRRVLADPHPGTRVAAAIALGKTREPAAVLDLKALLRDGDDRVREAAALGLGLSGRHEAVDYLVALMNDTPAGRGLVNATQVDAWTRQYAALGAGLVGDPRAAPFLEAVAVDEDRRQKDLAVFAASALGILRDTNAVPTLCRLVADVERPEVVRGAAAVALGKIGDRSPLVLQALVPVLRERHPSVVQGAAVALGLLARSTEKSVLAALDRCLHRGLDSTTQAQCLMAIGRIGGDLALDISLGELDSRGALAGYAPLAVALASRGTARGAEAREAIKATLRRSKDREVRGACHLAFGLMATRSQLPALIRVVESSKDPFEKTAAVAALGLLGEGKAADAVLGVLRETRDPELQHEAALSLAMLGERKKSVAELMELVRGARSSYLLGGCALALGLVGDEEAARGLALLSESSSSSAEVRSFSAGALGVLADPLALPVLYRFRAQNLYYMELPAMRQLLLLL